MIKKLSGVYLAILFLILAISGCSNLPNAQATATAAPTQAIQTPTAQSTEASAAAPTTINLSIWLPPQFAPNLDTSASTLLQEQLDAFNALYPNLNVTYRIKAETGDASLLESLQTANDAAPLVLPDLILISHADLYTAIEDQLVYPYPVTLTPEEDSDWYPVAYKLSQYQDQTFFYPLAADALVAVYNPEGIETFPASWGDLLQGEETLSFPPADPEAYTTLAFYTAEGGTFFDEEENITLDELPLTKVLEWYLNLHDAGLLLSNPAQIATDEQAWEQFTFGRADIAITRTSRYFNLNSSLYQTAALPTSDGNPFTMVDSWGWAITTPDPNEQAAAAELARFLSESGFASQWTEAAQLLPLRPTAVTTWQNVQNRSVAEQLLPVARAAPPPEVFSTVSSPLQEAVLDVLTAVQTPEEAASEVVATVDK
ncbi:extracellular solute-binding protein [bacterium]|nr:extracellular solute-binding protein [bacterium]